MFFKIYKAVLWEKAEGLRTLSPHRVQTLLEDCRNIKVKRLFFWFAERHEPAWLKKIDRDRIDLGKRKALDRAGWET